MATGTNSPAREKEYLTRVVVDTVAAGDIVLAAGVENKKIRLYRLVLSAGAAQVATIRDSAPTDLLPKLQLGSLVLDFDGHPWATCDTGEDLVLHLANAVQTSGVFWYWIEE
jgi:hypothetical protein